MKVRKNVRNIKTNTKDSTPFTIKTSGKAFKILSDNLYSDKHAAIIRELSCNAYDSHIEANKENVPFEIHLPTKWQPWLSVKDYGVGMSHEQMLNLYTSYFDSDKTDTNELTGVLGLGSKSPFAYTDVFTVTSIHGGKKRIYSCFIDSDGTPNITLMDESDTDDCSGVEVKLTVKPNDFDDFSRKAGHILSVFKVRPKVTGPKEFTYDKVKTIFSGKDWSFNNSISHVPRAIQGNVFYPINYESVKGQLNDKQLFVLQNRFDINFDIGELDVAASREDLSYDNITSENIKNKAKKVYDRFHSTVTRHLNKCNTLWEAKLYIKKIIGNMYYHTGFKFFYKGKEIFDNDFQAGHVNGVKIISYSTQYSNIIKRTDLSHEPYIRIAASESKCFIINDEERKGISKARYLVSTDRNVRIVYLIEGDHKAFFNLIGNPPYKMASSIPTPPKITGLYTRDSKRIFAPITYGQFDKGKSVYYDSIKEQKRIFYMATKHNTIYGGGEKLSFAMVRNYIKTAKQLGIINSDTVVYGISTFNIKRNKLESQKQFKEFFAYTKKRVISKINKLKDEILEHKKIVANYEYIKPDIELCRIMGNDENIATVLRGSRFIKIKEEHDNIKKLYYKNDEIINALIKMVTFFGLNIDIDVHDDIELITDRYPLLKIIEHWNMRRNFDEICEYIKLVDDNLK